MFFTADHHFGHANIIPLCGRPFGDLHEMNAAMIDAWNASVRPKDDVWHLGDFAYRCDADTRAGIFERLNGRKRLVIGNHDDRKTLDLPWAEPPVHLAIVRTEASRIVLCHYGLRVWPGMHHGAISLYGHSHGRLPGNSRSLDVGVDCWDFLPVSIDDIRRRMQELPLCGDPEKDT